MEEILNCMKVGLPCEHILEMVVNECDKQFKDVDRFFESIGLLDESISIDDAIAIVKEWKESFDKELLNVQ